RERGAEILTTISDGGDGFRARELWALVVGGLGQRGRFARADSRAGTWAGGAQLGALVVLLVTAAASLARRGGGGGRTGGRWWGCSSPRPGASTRWSGKSGTSASACAGRSTW